jgi:hypothetical protein
LQQENSPLRGSTPHKLAAFSLAVLHINVPPGVFKTAILEHTIDEDTVVEYNVLVFEGLVFKSVHCQIPLIGWCDHQDLTAGEIPKRRLGILAFFSPADANGVERLTSPGRARNLIRWPLVQNGAMDFRPTFTLRAVNRPHSGGCAFLMACRSPLGWIAWELPEWFLMWNVGVQPRPLLKEAASKAGWAGVSPK